MNINSKNYLVSGGQSTEIKIWNDQYSNELSVSSSGPVSSLAYLDQFRYLAVGSQKTLTIFEMVNYQYTSSNLPVYTGVLNAIVVLPTSLYYVSGSSDSTIEIWNTTSNTLITTLTPGHTGSVNALAVLNSTQYIVSGSDDMTLKIWNSTSFQLITTLTDNIDNPILSLAIVPSTQYIVSGTIDQISVWTSGIDSASFKYIFSIADPGYSLAILPLTEAIVSTSSKANGQINLWNSTSFSELPIASSAPSPNLDFKYVHFAVVPSTGYIVASYQLLTIFIYDSSSFKSIANLTGHATPIKAITVVPSSENIVSVDIVNGVIKIWSSKSFYCIATLNGNGPITSFSLPTAETIVGTINNNIIAWQITYNTSFTANTLNGFPFTMDSFVTALAFPNSKKLAVGLSSSTIRIYDITAFTYFLLYLNDKVTCLLSVNNGQYLAAGSDSGSKKISIWDSNFNKIQDLNVHNGRINSLTMWANQSYLVSSSMDTSIIIWKAATTFTQIQTLIQDKRQTESIIELKNGMLASASDDFTVKIWNQSNIYQLKISLTGHTNNVFALVEIPSLNQFATSSKDRTIIIWNIYDLTRIYTLYGHLRSVISLELITTNNNQSVYLASGSCDKTIIIWDLNTYKQKTILRRHTDCVNALNFYKKKYLLSGSNDGRMIVWNAVTFVWQQDLIKLNQPIFVIKSSPFNLFSSYLAFGSADKNTSVFGNSYSLESNFDDFNGNVYCLAILTISKTIVSGSGAPDGLIWLWNSTSFVLIDQFQAHNAKVDVLAILPSKQYIVSGSHDNTIKIWNSTSYECIAVLEGHTGPVVSLSIVPSTEFIISGSEDTKIKIWNSTSSDYPCIKTLDEHDYAVNTLSIMPSDEYLISGSTSGQIIIWNNNFSFFQQLSASGSPSCYAFAVLRSSNEKLVSSAGNDIKIWSWESFNLIASLVGHTQLVSSLAVLNSTQSIVSGSFDFTVKIWDSTTFQCIATLRSKLNAFIDSNIQSLAILPNIESIFVGSNIQFEVWSFKEFSYLCNLNGHNNSVYSIDFAQNNELISGSQDQTIINWDLTKCHMINVVHQNKSKKFKNLVFVSNEDFYRNFLIFILGILSVLSLSNGDLVTSTQDKTIKLWETNIFYNISTIF